MRNNVIDFQPKETKKINKKKLAITISIIVLLLTISISEWIFTFISSNYLNWDRSELIWKLLRQSRLFPQSASI